MASSQKKSPKTLALLAATIFLLQFGLVAADGQNQPQELKWKLKKGQKYFLTLKMDLKTIESAGGFDNESPTKQDVYFEWEVLEANENDFKIQQTLKRMTLQIKTPFKVVEFDSDDEPDEKDPLGDVIRPLLGVKVTQTMKRSGEIVSVELEPSAKQKLKQNPMLNQFLSPEGMKKAFGQNMAILPENKISKGSTWNASVETNDPQSGKTTISNQYEYLGIDEKTKLHKIAVNSEMKVTDPNLELKNQDIKGTMLFDNEKGVLHSTTISQNVELTTTVYGQKVLIKSTGTTSIKMESK